MVTDLTTARIDVSNQRSRRISPLGQNLERWAVSIAAVCFFVVLAYIATGGPIFETNDAVMSTISAGIGFVDRPDEHLQFIHFFFGKILNALYTWTQSVQWYGVGMVAGQVVAMTVIFRLLLGKGGFRVGTAVGCAFLLATCLRPVVLMQFTTTSALLTSAGALLLLIGAEKGRVLQLKFMAPSLVLISLGAMTRFNSAKLIIAMAAIVIGARFLCQWKWKKLIPAVVAIAIALGTVIGIEKTNFAYYDNTGWEEYYRLDKNRFALVVKMFDVAEPRTRAAFESIGWSPADLQMFLRWYVLDPQTFTGEKFDKVVAAMPHLSSGVTAKKFMEYVEDIADDDTILPMVFAIGLLLFCTARRRFPIKAGLAAAAITCLIGVYLILALHFPARVYASMLQFLMIALLWYASPAILRRLSPVPYGQVFYPACMIILLMLPVIPYYKGRVAEKHSGARELKRVLAKINPDPKDLYVSFAGGYPLRYISPFDDLRDYFKNLNLVGADLSGRAPYTLERLKKWGLSPILLPNMDKPGVYILSDPITNEGISSYMAEHFSKQVGYKLLYEDNKLPLNLYKVSIGPLAPRDDTDQSALCPNFDEQSLILMPSGSAGWRLKRMQKIGEDSTRKTTAFEYEHFPSQKLALQEPLPLEAGRFTHFCFEISVDPWMSYERNVRVRVGVNSSKQPVTLFVPLLSDGKMHRYVCSLQSLGVKAGDQITRLDLQLNPRHMLAKPARCEIGRIGLLAVGTQSSDSAQQSPIASGMESRRP